MADSGKQYGLFVPKKSNQLLQARPSIFGEDSDSDSGEGVSRPGRVFTNESVQKRQTQLDIKRALEQDPTVYQYDEVYEEMEEKKMEQKNRRKDPEKKPKYIQALLATADRRKREQERRNERKVQKEREAEGEEFKDKESFVTSAYRKKLEEFQAMDEHERLQDRIEEMTDVAKQKDLSGFYRHLYRQKVCDDNDDEEIKIKQEKIDLEVDHREKRGTSEEAGWPAVRTDESDQEKVEISRLEERRYRKRKVTSSSDSGSERKMDCRKRTKGRRSYGDTDSSSSISTSSSISSSEDSGDERKIKKKNTKVGKIVNGKKDEENKESVCDEQGSKETLKDAEHQKMNGEISDSESAVPASSTEIPNHQGPEEPKPNIWEKKTVGVIFEAALQRYLERKATKLAGS